MVELVDTLVSGTSALTGMEVQVFFRGRSEEKRSKRKLGSFFCLAEEDGLPSGDLKIKGPPFGGSFFLFFPEEDLIRNSRRAKARKSGHGWPRQAVQASRKTETGLSRSGGQVFFRGRSEEKRSKRKLGSFFLPSGRRRFSSGDDLSLYQGGRRIPVSMPGAFFR